MRLPWVRRELAACLICISFLVFTGTLFSDSDYPYDEDYVGDNAFCGHENTMIEQVFCRCSPTVANNLNFNEWINKLGGMTDLAQTVNTETYTWQTMPFVSVGGTGPYTFAPWSDTWGICVYFESCSFGLAQNNPDIVDSMVDLLNWEASLLNLAPDDTCWLVGLITDFGGPFIVPGVDTTGMTKKANKLSIIKYTIGLKDFLHEYGHTYKNRINGAQNAEDYTWPNGNFEHYGVFNIPALITPSNYNLNFMFYSDACGNDADEKYKALSFPFYTWDPYHSYRWNAQW